MSNFYNSSLLFFQPNGRFEINKKICLSISGHHPETWQPSWSIRTALLALIAFMSSPGNGAIGSLEYTKDERRILAKKSRKWECNDCGKVVHFLSTSKCQPVTQEESDMINRIALKAEDVIKKDYELNNETSSLNNFKDSSKNKGTTVHSNRVSRSATEEGALVANSNENSNLKGLMWAVIAAIIVLVARRLFLL